MPSIRFNWRVAVVGTLAVGSILMPQLSAYLGALSAVAQSQPQYNSSAPVVELSPGWGCSHTSEKVVLNAIN